MKPTSKLFLATITVMISLLLASCGNDETKTPAYQHGYDDGYSDGVSTTCQACDNNAEDNHQQELCDNICS